MANSFQIWNEGQSRSLGLTPKGNEISLALGSSQIALTPEDARALSLYLLNAVNDIEITKENEEERYGLNEL